MDGQISVLRVGLADAGVDLPAGMEVTDARTAEEALAALPGGYGCVVSAADLPDASGVELLADVRADHGALPFVLAPADGDEALAAEAVEAGVTDYVPRDDRADLAGRVRAAVEEYRAEQSLREGVLAMETANEGISLLDGYGRFTYVNHSYAEMYGYEPEEMVGEHWKMLYPEGETEEMYDEVLPKVHETGSWQGETTGQRADGTTFPEQHSLAATDAGGLVCTVRDISEQKRRTRELRERRRDLQRLYEVAADTDLSFEEKLQALFDLGCERFGLDLGALARIDPETGHCRVEAVSDDHPQLRPGSEVNLSESYCRVLVDGDSPVGFTDPAEEGLEETITYREFGFSSYLGAGLDLADQAYATFFFLGEEPREEPFSEDERTFHHLMGELVRAELERKRNVDRLARLNELGRSLMETESPETIPDRVVEVAAEGFELPRTAVATLDDAASELVVRSRTDRLAGLPLDSLCAVDEPVWRAFASRERTVADVDLEGLGELVAVPLDGNGVIFTAAPPGERFPTSVLEFVETLASTVSAALDRADRERLLREREETLQARNETLARLNRLNDTVRKIDRGLVEADTRDEIADQLCRHLAESGPYEFAWYGEADDVSGEVVARTTAGGGGSYLDAVSIATDGGDDAPAARALRELSPQVVDNTLTDPPFEPWRRAALDRGYRSVMALPVAYSGTDYGVLTIYDDEPEAFDELARSVLSELGEKAGYAINAVERKSGLTSEQSVELTFEFGDSLALGRFAERTGCEFALEGLVQEPEGRLRAFLTATGADRETLVEAAGLLPVTDLAVVAERDADGDPSYLLEASLTSESFPARVLDHGGVVRDVAAGDGTPTATVRLPDTKQVRSFVGTLERWHPDLELVAKRQRDSPLRSRRGLWTDLEERLTPRQREALETAFFSGYFETPREVTGTDVADALGVSQPTFNSHLRAAQRKLLDLLMADEGRLPAEEAPTDPAAVD